jgi:spermidine synthase
MGLEIVGIRVLAPHFGQSIFEWGSLIGVFLAALSIGYYLGGRLVDRRPTPLLLSAFLLVAGLFVLALSLPGERGPDAHGVAWAVCDAILVRDFGPRANPMIACTILFFLPAMLMAVTSPFVIRLLVPSVQQAGRTAGIVYAVSTIGSIAGTLGTAFYLLQAWGTRGVLAGLGGMLIATAVLAAASCAARAATAAAAALFALLAIGQPAFAKERILLERDSPYHRLFVTEDESDRWLRSDNVWHTQMDLKDPHGRGLPYADYVDLAFLFNPGIKRVLVIGLGGGTVPKRFVRDYPQVRVDVVEIDPDVINIAGRYFDVHAGPRLAVHQADGRMFLRRSKQKWDLILLDAYYADTVPFFLCTREFFRIAKDHLNAGGVFVNNVIGATTGPQSRFFRSVYRTMAEIFPQVHAFRVPESGTRSINIEVFGVNAKDAITLDTLRRRAAQMQGKVIKDDQLSSRVGNYLRGAVRTDDVPTLTDDYAPVDKLIHLW